jgi:hypothetical protein
MRSELNAFDAKKEETFQIVDDNITFSFLAEDLFWEGLGLRVLKHFSFLEVLEHLLYIIFFKGQCFFLLSHTLEGFWKGRNKS